MNLFWYIALELYRLEFWPCLDFMLEQEIELVLIHMLIFAKITNYG